jgi:hypothetical protein
MDEASRGAPRYLEGREEVEKPRVLAMFRWVVGGMLKKKMRDLSKLTEAPEAFEKVLRRILRVQAS